MQRFISIEGFDANAKAQLLKQLCEQYAAAGKQETVSYKFGGHIPALISLKLIFSFSPMISTAIAICYLSGCISYYLREEPKLADLCYYKVTRYCAAEEGAQQQPRRQIVFLEEPSIDWCTDENGKNIVDCADNGCSPFAYLMLKMHNHVSMMNKATQEYPDDAIIVITNSINTDSAVFMEAFYEFGKINEIEYKVYKHWFQTFYDSNLEIFDKMRHIHVDVACSTQGCCEFHMFCKKKYEELFENRLIAAITEPDDNGNFSVETVNRVLRAIAKN